MPPVVLVTGASTGFGRATVSLAARRGHVVYAGVRSPERCAPFATDVRVVPLDVTVPEQREAAIARILAETGRIDALVNNAGVPLGGFLETVDEAEMRKLFDTNLFAVFALTKLVLPTMRAQGSGQIVMVSSMGGRMAMPGLGAYNSSKFALEGLSEAWRHELSPFGVRVTIVEPGPYKTEIFGRNKVVAEGAKEGPYAERAARLEAVADEMAAKGGDPAEVAERILAIVEGRQTALRHPMGPTSFLRTLLLRFAPFWVIERIVGRIAR